MILPLLQLPAGDLVRLAETPEEMEREVLAALASDTPEERVRRRAFACGQTWAHRVEALVPANAEADVVLPDGSRHEVGSGTHRWTVAAPAPLTEIVPRRGPVRWRV